MTFHNLEQVIGFLLIIVLFKWVAEKFERLYPDIEAHYYDGVDHAYDKKIKKGGRYYNEEATKDSWIKTLEFLRKHGA